MVTGKMLEEKQIQIPDSEFKTLNSLRSEGQTVMFAAVDGKFAGLIGVADSVKETAKEAIDELHRQNIEVIMMTGDNAKTAEAVAKKLLPQNNLSNQRPQSHLHG